MWITLKPCSRPSVALLAEGVDRNAQHTDVKPKKGDVALLAEGVDRNPTDMNLTVELTVALLAEGVDRNTPIYCGFRNFARRPPRGGRG